MEGSGQCWVGKQADESMLPVKQGSSHDLEAFSGFEGGGRRCVVALHSYAVIQSWKYDFYHNIIKTGEESNKSWS